MRCVFRSKPCEMCAGPDGEMEDVCVVGMVWVCLSDVFVEAGCRY
jgi:hypothetical protein